MGLNAIITAVLLLLDGRTLKQELIHSLTWWKVLDNDHCLASYLFIYAADLPVLVVFAHVADE